VIALPGRRRDHGWSQRRLSDYVEGDLSSRARRRLELHAADCPDCTRGIRAVRTLLRLMRSLGEGTTARAPVGVFDRVRADANRPIAMDLRRE
jgi:anti-sigma factor RsiW